MKEYRETERGDHTGAVEGETHPYHVEISNPAAARKRRAAAPLQRPLSRMVERFRQHCRVLWLGLHEKSRACYCFRLNHSHSHNRSIGR